MTCENIINSVDELAPNQYTVEQKLAWLSSVDGKLSDELLKHYSAGPNDPVLWMSEEGYTTDSEDLLIPAPWGEDVYVNYLLSKIASANGEITKYSNYSALFNAAYQEYCNHYTRNHMPVPAPGWKY